MAKFLVMIDTYATASFEIEAETEDEAYDKCDELIASDNFFDKYRKECDFFEPSVGMVTKEEGARV